MAVLGWQLTVGAPTVFVPALGVAGFESNDPQPGPRDKSKLGADDLLKMIPGEIVGPFITFQGLQVTDVAGVPWHQAVFYFFLIIGVILRGQASKPAGAGWGLRGVNWGIVVATAVAFFIWAHAVSADGPIVSNTVFHGLPAGISPSTIWGGIAGGFALLAPSLAAKGQT